MSHQSDVALSGPSLSRGVSVRRIALASALLACASPVPLTAQAAVCRGPDATATQIVDVVTDLVTGSSADNLTIRSKFQLPSSSSAGKIVLVADERICSKVRDAMNAAFQTPGLNRQIYVVKTTDGYAALDPSPGPGEWTPLVFVSKKYQFKGSLAAF